MNFFKKRSVEDDKTDSASAGYGEDSRSASENAENTLESRAQAIGAIIDEGTAEDDFQKMNACLSEHGSGSSEIFAFTDSHRAGNIIVSLIFVFLGLVLIPEITEAGEVITYSEKFAAGAEEHLAWLIIMLAIDIIVILKCIFGSGFERRYRKYYDLLKYKQVVLTADLADFAKVSERNVISDMKKAMKRGLLPQGYFGENYEIIFLTNASFQDYRDNYDARNAYYKKLISEYKSGSERPDKTAYLLESGREYLEKIGKESDILKNKIISSGIGEAGHMAEVVFRDADIYPEGDELLGIFVNDYFPAIEKILDMYSEVNSGQLKAENTALAKSELVSALRLVSNAYQKILFDFENQN